MAINWVCVGKSQHGYQYEDTDGTLKYATVSTVDFRAELNTNQPSPINELYNTKPVLSEGGVEAFVGLQVYPQGFTVYADSRISDVDAPAILLGGSLPERASTFLNKGIGESYTTGGGSAVG